MSTAGAIDFTYQYPFASEVGETNEGFGLSLATCGAKAEHPCFFNGGIRQPRMVGSMLLVLSEVVRRHFFMKRPPQMDPVVTSNEELLRFEGFSGCCGVYARVDLPAEAFDSEIQGRGTTNVDFNNPMRAALNRLRDEEEARLSVGRDSVTLSHGDEKIVEKKVKLPIRWLKGFSEVQAYQPALQLKLEVSAGEARKFLRGLPRGGKRVSYVTQLGKSLRLTQRSKPGSVPLSGNERIRVLEPLLNSAKSLRIWADDETGASAWEVVYSTGRFLLMISPELYRGFSGEGQVLEKLAGGRWKEALPYVEKHLTGQSQIKSADLAAQIGLASDEVEAALAVLGSRGLAGYDITSGRYFHRELPFEMDKVEALQPRLKGARKLLEEKRVAYMQRLSSDEFDMSVGGTGVDHHVRLREEGDRCSCPWFSKHQGQRGPCKHILAARMFVEQEALKLQEDAS